jgi:hypothetical protein
MVPHFVHNMGPNVGTSTLSSHGCALKMARWWHCQHDTSSDRTRFERILARSIGSIGSLMWG